MIKITEGFIGVGMINITEVFVGSERRAMSEGLTEIPKRRRFSYTLKQIGRSQSGFGHVV
jgi:hypothetical protein